MTAGRVILLRHGVTDWNADGRFQGQADVPLNDVGRQQARAAGRELAGWGISRIVSSDLSRAAETARLVAKECELDVVADARLREVNVGSWVGLDLDAAARLEPELLPALRAGRDFRRSPEGETATDAGKRVALALLDHAESAGDDEVLLAVGHGLSLRVGALLLMGLDYSHARLFGGLLNCHAAVLRPGGEYWRMLSYNVGSRT